MGSLTISSRTTNKVSGTYTTSNGGSGRFTLTRNEIRGYANSFNIQDGSNGIELLNESAVASGQDRDKFKYTFTITPDNPNALHTIKIGQASYETSGNSEIARHTLSYIANNNLALPTKAMIKNNPSVPYFYNAMGDYFMGEKVNNTQLRSEQAVSGAQLRADSSNESGSNLYYYNIPNLNGAGNSNPYSPTKDGNGQVSLGVNNGVLPPMPTFANIFKKTRDPNSYAALSTTQTIPNSSSYVSYGIANADSTYVVAVQNAISATLTYEGIMNGNIGIPRAVVGETYNEWISFGVKSEPYYRFSGTVFDDNGGIKAADPTQTGAPYVNNTDYFNGKKEASESGLSGSTITLANCSNPAIVYSATPTDANGNYQILVPSSQVPNALCVVEIANSARTHPIATSPSSIAVTVNTGSINQNPVNFGRVIQDNAALVLEKFQFANQCNLSNLINDGNGTPYPYTKNAINSSNPNVAPMSCIAYKLTATNRANLVVNDIKIKDELAKKGNNTAQVTAILFDNVKRTSRPAPAVGFTDALKDGENGTITTAAFALNHKTSRSFYFNTRYGSTQSP